MNALTMQNPRHKWLGNKNNKKIIADYTSKTKYIVGVNVYTIKFHYCMKLPIMYPTVATNIWDNWIPNI